MKTNINIGNGINISARYSISLKQYDKANELLLATIK